MSSFPEMITETRISDLARRECRPCEGLVDPLTTEAAQELLKQLPGWQLEAKMITRQYQFANYFESVAFLNASAFISHSSDHHPEIFITYNTVKISYWTHSIDGLSENDFICAAKTDAVLAL